MEWWKEGYTNSLTAYILESFNRIFLIEFGQYSQNAILDIRLIYQGKSCKIRNRLWHTDTDTIQCAYTPR